MISLSDNQLKILLDAARPLPVEKRDVYLRRIAAMLILRGGYGCYDDADVTDAARLALTGLAQSPAALCLKTVVTLVWGNEGHGPANGDRGGSGVAGRQHVSTAGKR
jgi:hypothetical protein